MNQTFVKSTVILSAATLASKILGSIFRIPLQNIAGDEVLGIFSLVYPVYMVALILSVAGIPIAISKLISEAIVYKDDERVYKIYITAVILALLFGLTSFMLIYSFSSQIAEVLGGQTTRLALIIVSSTLVVAPYMAVYRGYFQGFADMTPTAVSQVLEQLIRVGFILLIAYLLVSRNYGDEAVAGGIMAGSVLGAIASAVYLQWLFIRSPLKPQLNMFKYSLADFKEMGKTILSISLPICIGAITMALLNFVDSITIPYGLRNFSPGLAQNINYLYGIYGRGLSLVQIATVLSTSIVLPLIPLLTTTLAEKNHKQARAIVERSHRLTHLVSWPAAFGLLALTLPLNLALFKDLEGSAVLAVIGFSSVFTSLSILGTGILQGINQAKQAAAIIIFGVVLKAILNLILLHFYGLAGAAYSTLAVYILIFILNTYFIFRIIPFTVWKRNDYSIVASAIIMGTVIGIPALSFQFETWSRLAALGYSAVSIAAGALIYLFVLIFTKGIDINELKTLPFFKKRKQRKSRQ